jgi:hypothetical protein
MFHELWLGWMLNPLLKVDYSFYSKNIFKSIEEFRGAVISANKFIPTKIANLGYSR